MQSAFQATNFCVLSYSELTLLQGKKGKRGYDPPNGRKWTPPPPYEIIDNNSNNTDFGVVVVVEVGEALEYLSWVFNPLFVIFQFV